LPELADLFSALLPTEYGPSLKDAVLDVNDLSEWDSALTATLARRVSRVRTWIDASRPAYAYLVDGEWDVHHLRALLRRIGRGESGPGEASHGVGDAFVPLGVFTRERYREAQAADSPRDLCARLQSWLPGWSETLRSFLDPPGQPPVGLRELELQLDDEHFRRLAGCVRRIGRWDDGSILRRYLALLVDLTNVRTALRFLGRPLPPDRVAALYLRRGTLSEAVFAGLMTADSVEELRRRLPRGALRVAVTQGLAKAPIARWGLAFERLGDQQVRRLVRRLVRRWPVSVAIPLDYLARARNEWVNLKLIACGIGYRLPGERVREGLVYE